MTKSIFTDAYKLLISILVKERNDAKITQQKLADRLNKHQSFVAKYESRERRLDVVELIQITEALNIDIVPLIHKIQACLNVDA